MFGPQQSDHCTAVGIDHRIALICPLHFTFSMLIDIILYITVFIVCVGEKLSVLSDSRHYIQGVAWDPAGVMLATLSSDR